MATRALNTLRARPPSCISPNPLNIRLPLRLFTPFPSSTVLTLPLFASQIYVQITNSIVTLLKNFNSILQVRPSIVTQAQFDELSDMKVRWDREKRLQEQENLRRIIEDKETTDTDSDEQRENELARQFSRSSSGHMSVMYDDLAPKRTRNYNHE